MNSFLKKTFCFLLVSFLCVFAASLFLKVNAASYTYTFTSKAWADSSNSFTSGQDGYALTSGRGIQVTTAATGAYATSNSSYSNVASIVVTYSTNASKGAGSIEIQVGANAAQSKNVTKDGGTTDRTLTWNYSPVQSGVVKITVNCTTNSIYVKSITINEYVSVSGVSLNKNSVSLAPRNTEQLTATVLPDNASNKDVTWNSSNESIATVSNSGLVTAVASGSATITATSQADGTKFASCIVTVTAAVSATGVEVPATEYAYVGGTEQLVANVLPANASNKTVTWSSADESIATVTADGLVTAVAVGSVSITATTVDGGFTDICSFEVKALPASGEVSVLDALKIASASGNAYSVNTYTTIGRVKSATDSKNFVLTDEANDIDVYQSSIACSVGDRIKVTGKLKNHNLSMLEYASPTVKKLFNVTFESNGGSAVAGLVDVESGSKINAPANPTKAGQTFMGWYKDELLTDDWDFNSDTVTSSITLYAFYLDSLIGEIQTRLNAVHSDMFLAYSYFGSYYGFGLTRDKMTFASSGYCNFTSKYYSGNAYKTDGKIQLRSDQNTSGIILVDNDKGNIKRVVVDWNSSTVNGRTLNVYGSNTPYSSAADLYDANKCGDLLGTIVCGTSTSLDITGDYTYIGLRSNSGALYLNYVIADNNETTSVDFRFKCAVDESVSGVLGGAQGTYGIEVSDGTTTKRYASDNELLYTQGGKTYVVIKLGDVFTDLSRLTDEFTVRAYAYYNGEYYYSSQPVTYSFVSLLQTYIDLNNPTFNAQISGLKEILIDIGLLN